MNYDDEIKVLKDAYYHTFNRLTIDEERTIEFYYKLGTARGVNGFDYVMEAIKRASMKQGLNKPISYVASLCKNFYKNGLFAQQSQEEIDILEYVSGKIGEISDDNLRLIQKSISTIGAVKVMAAAAEVLNNSKLQDIIISEIILKTVELWD